MAEYKRSAKRDTLVSMKYNVPAKQEEGVRFRTIEEFNTILLLNQLWLLEYIDSLFAKVFKIHIIEKEFVGPS